ncbi:alpha-(1,3)-fucosyltransferase C-like [Chironomus tepperi]|uniref:alpha-(1,3)-fucosyltransferase C-like n=1 Tax=Chironomus tepperi TaxID=113505 RepID=UPI00391FA73D
MNLKKLFINLTFVCLFGLFSLFFFTFTSLTNQSKTNSNDYSVNTLQNEKNVTNILFWIKYWNDPSWYIGGDEEGEQMLQSIGCPTKKCFFTHNRNYLPNITDFDAILFHGAEYLHDSVPHERSQHQLYVYTVLESPFLCFENLNRFQNFFNLTMTYRFDSDIHWHYGSFFDKQTNELVAPLKMPNWKIPENDFYDQELMKVFKNKKQKIAWFASNCNSNSKREILVSKIQEHIQVDIYGKCGTHSCDPKSSNCDKMLTSDYMFYLSFENALCKDYVTEKLYRPLNEIIIPIVFNGANTSLYAPPQSYIDVNDFDNVDALVTHLKYLMNNPEAYIKYFWWKKHYYVVDHKPTFKKGFCDLCMKLRDKNYHNEIHSYGNIKDWWESGMCTKESRIKF